MYRFVFRMTNTAVSTVTLRDSQQIICIFFPFLLSLIIIIRSLFWTFLFWKVFTVGSGVNLHVHKPVRRELLCTYAYSQFVAVVGTLESTCLKRWGLSKLFPTSQGLRGPWIQAAHLRTNCDVTAENRAWERWALTVYEQLDYKCCASGGKHLLQVIEPDKFDTKENEVWDLGVRLRYSAWNGSLFYRSLSVERR